MASGARGFEVYVCKGLLATCHVMGKKARILTLPRYWDIGSRMVFARFLILRFQCF